MKMYMRIERLPNLDDYGYVISSEENSGKEIPEGTFKDLMGNNPVFEVITPMNILIPINEFNTSVYNYLK